MMKTSFPPREFVTIAKPGQTRPTRRRMIADFQPGTDRISLRCLLIGQCLCLVFPFCILIVIGSVHEAKSIGVIDSKKAGEPMRVVGVQIVDCANGAQLQPWRLVHVWMPVYSVNLLRSAGHPAPDIDVRLLSGGDQWDARIRDWRSGEIGCARHVNSSNENIRADLGYLQHRRRQC
jgi:hypothetical protein